MKRRTFLTLLASAVSERALAQATVVPSCGSVTLTPGTPHNVTIDVNGQSCESGAAGVATSTWSAADAAANAMTLSNGGLTVAFLNAGYQSIRGTNSQTSGKFYAEFLNTASGVLETGFGFASASFTSTSYLGGSAYSFGCFNAGSGNVSSPSADFTSIVTVASSPAAANDVWAIALDLTAGKFWLARNNVWFGSGAPGSGGNPLATFVAPALGQTYFPAITGNSSGCGVWTLQSTAASQTYAPPAGFTPWG